MFKPYCKCINCNHLKDAIFFQKDECYKRVLLDISKAIKAAEEMNDLNIYSWLKDLDKKIRTFEKTYNKR